MANEFTIDDDVPMFTIDDDIPLPAGGPNARYPFRAMRIGQSFFLPEEAGLKAVAASRNYKFSSEGISFASRKRVEKGVVGYRIWRMK